MGVLSKSISADAMFRPATTCVASFLVVVAIVVVPVCSGETAVAPATNTPPSADTMMEELNLATASLKLPKAPASGGASGDEA